MEHDDMVSVQILKDGEEPYIIKHVSLEAIVEATLDSKNDKDMKKHQHLYPDYISCTFDYFMTKKEKDMFYNKFITPCHELSIEAHKDKAGNLTGVYTLQVDHAGVKDPTWWERCTRKPAEEKSTLCSFTLDSRKEPYLSEVRPSSPIYVKDTYYTQKL